MVLKIIWSAFAETQLDEIYSLGRIWINLKYHKMLIITKSKVGSRDADMTETCSGNHQ